jgi:hypothetical protein
MMMAFDYLDSLRTIEIRIQIKTRQAQHLRDTMSSITAPMDKEQVSHTKNVSAMQDTMAMVLDIEEEISDIKREINTIQYVESRRTNDSIEELEEYLKVAKDSLNYLKTGDWRE